MIISSGAFIVLLLAFFRETESLRSNHLGKASLKALTNSRCVHPALPAISSWHCVHRLHCTQQGWEGDHSGKSSIRGTYSTYLNGNGGGNGIDIGQKRRSFHKTLKFFRVVSKAIKFFVASSFLSILFGFGRVSKATAKDVHGSSSVITQSSPALNKNQLLIDDIQQSKKKVIVDMQVEETIHERQQPLKTRVLAKATTVKKQLSWERSVLEDVKASLIRLKDSLSGAKLDTLILLIVTSTIIPLFTRLSISPIIGFLMTGTLLGPTGLNWVKDVHMIDHLGEFGIVFFLFEMGLELSLEKLQAMRKDVFGLGTSQFLGTSLVFTIISMFFGMTVSQSIAIGGSLALSSSAFVLQLLKDKDATGTRHGKASFGILLLQDLAVVPLLIVVELLGKGGAGMGRALLAAGVKAVFALSSMSIVGKWILDPIFTMVAKSNSQEAFLSVILTTVLLMSFVTQGIGLSNTLGAFLAGLLLAETRYHYQIEADISPFRGLLLGFFFISVGFSIDIGLIVKEAPKIMVLLASLVVGKASIITLLSMLFDLPFSAALKTGLLCNQAGEFAFVAFGIAEKLKLLSPHLVKLLLTSVALSMALTPAMAELGIYMTKVIDQRAGMSKYEGKDSSAEELKMDLSPSQFVFICGYGRVGKMVCDMLDTKFIRYAAIDSSAEKAIKARNKGLPVFYGDINRPEVMKSFDVGNAMAVVITIDDMTATNKAVISIRKLFPDVPLIVRAQDSQHKERLMNMFDDVYAMAPALPEDSMLLTLPFGGAVLQNIGVDRVEIDAILEEKRKRYIDDYEDDGFDFFKAFNRRLPSSTGDEEQDEKDKTKREKKRDTEQGGDAEGSVSIDCEDNEDKIAILSPALDVIVPDPSNSAITIDKNTFSLPEAPKLKAIAAPGLLEDGETCHSGEDR